MTFTLINAKPSPFGRKVAIALLEKNLDYEVRYDLPWSGESCTPQFSPLQQLPILIDDRGEPIYDSTYILEWIETRYPDPPLLPIDIDRRLGAKKRQMLGERLMEIAQNLIFETHRPDPSAAWIERQTRKILGAFAELERMYSSSAAEEQIDLGDIAVGTTSFLLEFATATGLSQPLDALVWRGRYAALTRVLEKLEIRPSFVKTIPQPMELDLTATLA